MQQLGQDEMVNLKNTYSKYERSKGSMADFKKMVNLLSKNNRKIITEEYAFFAKIYIGNSVWCYSDHQVNEFSQLCNAVSRNASAFLKKNPEFLVDEYSAITVSNSLAIKQHIDETVSYFDMKACYWNIAYNCGYITTNTYMQGLANKDARTLALGYLGKKHVYQFYDKGIAKPKVYRKDTYMIWHAILKKTNIIYEELREIVSDEHFYFYNTDCIYCHPKYDRVIHAYFKSKEIAYESKKYILTGIDDDMFYLDEIGSSKKQKILLNNDISQDGSS